MTPMQQKMYEICAKEISIYDFINRFHYHLPILQDAKLAFEKTEEEYKEIIGKNKYNAYSSFYQCRHQLYKRIGLKAPCVDYIINGGFVARVHNRLIKAIQPTMTIRKFSGQFVGISRTF